jgi:PAS domain S-box-containing protein
MSAHKAKILDIMGTEETVASQALDAVDVTPDDMQSHGTLHDHRIELVMGIEELHQEQVELREHEDLYRPLFENMINGLAYCRMSFDNDTPSDFTYLAVNKSFEQLTGLKDVVGKKVTEVIPGIRETDANLLAIYGRVARTGNPERFEMFVKALRMWFCVSVYCPAPEHFVAVFEIITERKQAEKERIANERRMSSLYEISQYPFTNEQEFLDHALGEVICLTDSKFGYIYFYNEQTRQFILNTWSPGVMRQCSVQEQKTVYDLDSTGIWGEAVRQRKPILVNDFQADHSLKKGYPEGHVDLQRFLTVPVIVDEAIVAVVGVANKEDDYTDSDKMQLKLFMDSVWMITMRKQNEEALRESEEHHRDILHTAMDGIFLTDREGNLEEVNEAYCRMSGYSVQELLTMSISGLAVAETIDGVADRIRKIIEQGESRYETRHRRKDGTIYDVEVSAKFRTTKGGHLVVFLRDITERRLTENARREAEEDRAKLEAQLRQAQKMESIGRLAGGVAHDFNNMLTIIFGHVQLALMDENLSTPLHTSLEEIRNAAERSADLTRQLLAFARKQIIAPLALDLNKSVGGMLKMLQRLIGEDIHLTWKPASNLWPVKMDPSQIDQILANLCINARDAISDVGKITIETENMVFDNDYCTTHLGFSPGEYVRLAVSDNGRGMDKETLSKIFEPFFTTKGIGEGTGLGLATVYGIVKQNNGFINVYSEPNLGTTFTIYLSRLEGKTGQTDKRCKQELPSHGHETILLVEDEPAILKITSLMLEMQGYTVLAASTPDEAIRVAGEYAGKIHLLMTDVIMPGMNGRDLAKCLLTGFPQMKHLFMSGYTANVIAHHGVLDEGVNFIQKPFSLPALANKVRDILSTQWDQE